MIEVRYNLKNRPEPQHHIAGPPTYDYLQTTQWFEGFKEELQQMKTDAENWVPKHREKANLEGVSSEETIIELTKEILGETS